MSSSCGIVIPKIHRQQNTYFYLGRKKVREKFGSQRTDGHHHRAFSPFLSLSLFIAIRSPFRIIHDANTHTVRVVVVGSTVQRSH